MVDIEVDKDLSFLDPLFETIFEIPDSFVQIKRTVTDVLDDLGSIRVLSHKTNILMKSFNYLLQGLDNPLTLSKHDLLYIFMIIYKIYDII